MCLALDTYIQIGRQQLQHLASHDPLTGLSNRALLVDRLAQAITFAHRANRHVAVLFIDLDRFKNINDSLGHEKGHTPTLANVLSESGRFLLKRDEADVIVDGIVAKTREWQAEFAKLGVTQHDIALCARYILRPALFV